MEFANREGAGAAPAGYMPWFDVPGRKTADVTVAFRALVTLGWLSRSDLWSLDTGCVWGGCLSALPLAPERTSVDATVQVRCAAAQQPGT